MWFPRNGISSPLGLIHLPMLGWLDAEWQYTRPSAWPEFASMPLLLDMLSLILLLSPTPEWIGEWENGIDGVWSMENV